MTTPAGRTFGTILHRVLADLIKASGTAWSPEQLLQWLALHPLVRACIVGTEVKTRNQLAVALSVYRHHFVLSERWHLVDIDVRTPHAELDVVWCRDDGVIMADEIKSGAMTGSAMRHLEEQLARQLTDAPTLYGEPFSGVRAVLLQAPGDSRFFGIDGSIGPANTMDSSSTRRDA